MSYHPRVTATAQSAPAPADDIRRHIPNALTASRFVLAGVFVALLSTGHPAVATDPTADRISVLLDQSTSLLIVAALVFALAALTDALDGQLSRLWGVESRLGRIMDPLADKVLVLGGFVLLAGPTFTAQHPAGGTYQLSGIDAWMVIVILTREMLVTSIRGMYEAEGFDFSAARIGKIKMIAQSVAVPLLIVLVAVVPVRSGDAGRLWVLAIAWGVTAISAASAWPYVHKAYLAGTGRIKPPPPRTPRPKPKLGQVSDRVEIPVTNVRKRSRPGPPTRAGSKRTKPR